MTPATMRILPPLAALTLTAALAGSAFASGIFRAALPPAPSTRIPLHITKVVTQADTCSLVDFEGVGDIQPVGTYNGPVRVTFGSSWLGVVDLDDGGNGNFANEPSPSTVAAFMDRNDLSIGLVPPVRLVEFSYVASRIGVPVMLNAYDVNGNLVGTATGNTVGHRDDGANCTGDPTGDFCLWDKITLVSTGNLITKIEIDGATAAQFGIDNLVVCVRPTPTSTSRKTWGSLKEHYR